MTGVRLTSKGLAARSTEDYIIKTKFWKCDVDNELAK